jgi:hypothetical protein
MFPVIVFMLMLKLFFFVSSSHFFSLFFFFNRLWAQALLPNQEEAEKKIYGS